MERAAIDKQSQVVSEELEKYKEYIERVEL
jgi:hypothetical protein